MTDYEYTVYSCRHRVKLTSVNVPGGRVAFTSVALLEYKVTFSTAEVLGNVVAFTRVDVVGYEVVASTLMFLAV